MKDQTDSAKSDILIEGLKKAESSGWEAQGLRNADVYIIDNRSIGNYFEQDARIYGSVTGRGYERHTIASTKEIVGQVPIQDIDKTCHVYIETPGYHQAHSILNENHLVVLRGNSNFGKQTTAIYLLSKLASGEIGEIYEFNPAIEDLTLIECESNKSYLIDTLAPSNKERQKIDKYILKKISQKFEQKNSYLVITIDDRWHFSQEALDEYVLNWHYLPVNEKVLENHLLWYLKDQASTEDVQILLQADPVQSLLEDKLLPRDVDRLAKLLVGVFKRELELEEALSHFDSRIYQQVESWFEQHSELNQRIFFITLAALSGSKYQAVDDASQRLKSLVQFSQNKKDEIDVNIDSIFGITRRSFLKDVCANLAEGYENTEFGLSSVEIIKLNNSRFQPAILSYVWNEYSYMRGSLLVWLYELGSDRNSEVRNRAAAAVGELSRYDFAGVLDHVLLPWANCQDQKLQRLVALSLSIPVLDSSVASQVLALLHYWSGLTDNSRLRWAAAVAYGSYVGLRFPDAALRDLFLIAKTESEDLFIAAAESITVLFEAGEFLPIQYLKVLNIIQEWTEPTRNDQERQIGLLIFWFLSYTAKVKSDSSTSQLPTIPWLVWEERKHFAEDSTAKRLYENIIVRLLGRSLDIKPTRKLILDELQYWLKLADDDCRLYPVLGGIIFKLILSGTRQQERIFNYLGRWASNNPPNTAGKILSKIKQHLDIH